ncbi:hypothetical protein AB0B89_23745 [Sphaerisporangium sp. NPDC049002]|uniref:hypothetical protein n=1 Tax=Sphaerisporangium sp. NPDC049002 TaxID=3155392 RepID=UPI0033E439B6
MTSRRDATSPAASRGRAEPTPIQPHRGQIWRPWAKKRRGRLITITSVLPGYVVGLSSPEKGRGNTVLVRIPRCRLGEYQLIEEAPHASA